VVLKLAGKKLLTEYMKDIFELILQNVFIHCFNTQRNKCISGICCWYQTGKNHELRGVCNNSKRLK